MDKSALQRWRALDARVVLLAFADYARRDETFTPVKDARTERWHVTVASKEFHFVITGPKYWDEFGLAGGGGAIDLVMHLFNCAYRDAVRRLLRSPLNSQRDLQRAAHQ